MEPSFAASTALSRGAFHRARSWFALLAFALFAFAAGSGLACSGPKSPEGSTFEERAEVPPFAFDSLDERRVSREALLGKPAVLVFLTTWDIVSQAAVGKLVKMAERDGESVRYVLVALHEPHERELVEAYVRSTKFKGPAALSDSETRAGRGPLGDVHVVPTVLVVDARGRLTAKFVGLTKTEVLREAVEAAKKSPDRVGE